MGEGLVLLSGKEMVGTGKDSFRCSFVHGNKIFRLIMRVKKSLFVEYLRG